MSYPMWWRTIEFGVKNLALHKLRSVLTTLGVILGVTSVIVMLAIGEASKRESLDQIRRLGETNIIIRSVRPTAQGEVAWSGSQTNQSIVLEYGLRYRDYDLLLADIPTLSGSVPVSQVVADAQHRHRVVSGMRILATTPKYLPIKHLRMRHGRFLTEADLFSRANVIVLAAPTAERLFSFEDPVGKSVFIGSGAFRVIGVVAPRVHRTGPTEQDSSRVCYMPITTARGRFGDLKVEMRAGGISYERTQLAEITLRARNAQLVPQTASMARSLLRWRHPHQHDYQVQVPLELLQQAEQERRIWNLVLGSVAGISLVVGGIGIMNIMLASVTERTREIGIRRALGATRRNIITQFLVETVVLSSTGGVLGVLLGVAIPIAITQFAEINTIVTWWSVLLAFVISVTVGIVFGIYPAQRAASLMPVEALRYQ